MCAVCIRTLKVPDCSLGQLSTCRCVGCESCLSFAGRVVCRIQCAQRSQLIARRGGSLLALRTVVYTKQKIVRVTEHIRELLAVNA